MSRVALFAAAAVALSGCLAAGAGPALVVLALLAAAACAGNGEPDAAGQEELCCQNGRTATCLCPASTICNFGMNVTFCSDGTCFQRGTDSCPVDAGLPDAGGTFPTCCVNGHTTTCYCPPGAACNFLGYLYCPDGTCILADGGNCGADAAP